MTELVAQVVNAAPNTVIAATLVYLVVSQRWIQKAIDELKDDFKKHLGRE